MDWSSEHAETLQTKEGVSEQRVGQQLGCVCGWGRGWERDRQRDLCRFLDHIDGQVPGQGHPLAGSALEETLESLRHTIQIFAERQQQYQEAIQELDLQLAQTPQGRVQAAQVNFPSVLQEICCVASLGTTLGREGGPESGSLCSP